jgi:hypothetical protein
VVNGNLPPHITEDDVRAISQAIIPTVADEFWNAAIDAAVAAIDAAEHEYDNNYHDVPMSPRARVAALRRGVQK